MLTKLIRAVVWYILENYPDIVVGVLKQFGCHIHRNPKKREAVNG